MEQTGTDKNNRTLRDSMAFNIIGAIVLLVILFGAIVSTIGYFGFTDAFKTEYATSTYHMADTATALINGDHLDAYLAGEAAEEYRETKENLDVYCERMNVSLVYVIKVDTGDYGRFVSIFNAVNNAVDNSSYTAWELGHKRDTTNDEYRRKYRAMYEQTAPYETVYRIKTTDGQHPHITTMVPVKGSDGKTRSILCIQRPMRELKDATRSYLIRIAVWAAALCVFASVVTAVYIRRRVVKPIRIASDEAVRFAKENTRGEPLGSLSKLREINNLARSIDTMETDMVRYIDNLTAATAEKERMGTELSLARTIQENSVPNRFPAFPGR